MGTIKERNGKDLIEAEEIKKKWEEYTEELYKKGLDLDYHDDLVTQPEPDILECEVKRVLGSILRTNLVEVMEFQVSYFNWHSWAMCQTATLNMPANLENSVVATGLEKVSFHSNPNERQWQRMFELVYNCTHFTLKQDYAQNPSS